MPFRNNRPPVNLSTRQIRRIQPSNNALLARRILMGGSRSTPVSSSSGAAPIRHVWTKNDEAARRAEHQDVQLKNDINAIADQVTAILLNKGKDYGYGTLEAKILEEEKPRSMWEQVKDVANLPRYAGALANFGVQTARSAVIGVPKIAAETAEGIILKPLGLNDGSDIEQLTGRDDWRNLSLKDQFSAAFRHNVPVISDVARGINDTATNIRHPERYAEAVRQGRILDTVISDIGNLALVAGGAGVAAKAAAPVVAGRAVTAGSAAGRAALALDTAGRGLTTAATLGAKIDDAPATIWRLPAKLPGVKQALASTPVVEARGAVRGYLNEKLPFIDPEVQHKRRFMAEQMRRTDADTFPFINEYQRKFEGLDTNIETAVLLARQDLPFLDKLDELRATYGEETVTNILDRTFDWNRPETRYGLPYKVTAAAISTARKYKEGTLHPDLSNMMDQLNDFHTRVNEKLTQDALDMGMNPEQLGDQPMTPVVEKAMRTPLEKLKRAMDAEAKVRQKLTEAELAVASKQARVTQTFANGKKVIYRSRLSKTDNYSLGKAEQRLADVRRAVGVYERRRIRAEHTAREVQARVMASTAAAPARYATVIRKAEDFSEAAKTEALALRAKGINATALEALADEWANVTLPELKAMGIDPEFLIGGDLWMAERKSRGPSQELLPREKRIIYQRLEEKIPFNSKDQLRLAVLRMENVGRTRAAHAFARQFGQNVRDILLTKYDPAVLDTFSSIEMARALDDMDYVPYSTTQLFSKMPESSVNYDSVAIPKNVWEDFVKTRVESNKIVRFLESANRSWKNTILPFSVMWHTGNTLGGMMMAMVGGGVTPVDLLASARELRRMSKRAQAAGMPGDLRSIMPFELQGMSLPGEIRRFAKLDPAMDVGIPTRIYRKAVGKENLEPSPFRKVVNRLYEANDFVDSYYRSVVYLTKKKKGLSHDRAVQNAINALGDYSKMSTFERRVLRNVIPFYPWLKHITTLAFRLPIEHPMRVIWTMKLAQEFAVEQDPDALPWEQGSIEAFGRKFSPSVLFPFSDVGGTLRPEDFGQNVSPVIKTMAGVGFGLNINEMDQIKRPGASVFSGADPLYDEPSAALNYVGSQFSIVNKIRNLMTEPVRRWPTGETRMVRVGDDGNANKIRLKIPHLNEEGEVVYETILARNPEGGEIRQPDVPMRAAKNKWDVALNLIGIPVPQPEQYEYTPLEIEATPNGDGTYSYEYNGVRYPVTRENGETYKGARGWGRKVSVRISHPNEYGVPIYETLTARTPDGTEIREPLTAGGDTAPIVIDAERGNDGLYYYTYNGKRVKLFRQDGTVFRAPDSWSKTEEELKKQEVQQRYLQALILRNASRA